MPLSKQFAYKARKRKNQKMLWWKVAQHGFLFLEPDTPAVPNEVPKDEVLGGSTAPPGQTITDMRKYPIIRIYFIDT